MDNLPDGCTLRDIDDAAAGRYGHVSTQVYWYCLTCENCEDHCNCEANGELQALEMRHAPAY